MAIKDVFSSMDERSDTPMGVMDHLDALREALVFSLVAWLVATIVALVFSPQILAWLKSPAQASEDLLQGLELTSGFSVMLTIGLWGGGALAAPLVAYAILKFIFPALAKREKIAIFCVLVFGSALFLAGVAFAYGKTLPLVVQAFQAINSWVGLKVEAIRIEGYISIIMKTVIAFGLVFQLPLVLIVLGWMGIVTSESLRRRRRAAIVTMFVLAMLLTPPDPMSQILMAVPLCVLYELSIWAVWLKERA